MKFAYKRVPLFSAVLDKSWCCRDLQISSDRTNENPAQMKKQIISLGIKPDLRKYCDFVTVAS